MVMAPQERTIFEGQNLDWLNGYLKGCREVAPERHESRRGPGRKFRSDCRKGLAGIPEILTPFQERVFIMIGMASGGLWNSPIHWDGVRWTNPVLLSIPFNTEISTFDNSVLMSLVVQSARYGIRMAIRIQNLKLVLQFSAMGGNDGMNRVHPGIADMVAAVADETQTCGGCRYFEPLSGGPEHGGDEDEVVTGSCRYKRKAMPLSITRNSMALVNQSNPQADWTGCGCWTAKGHEFDQETRNAQ